MYINKFIFTNKVCSTNSPKLLKVVRTYPNSYKYSIGERVCVTLGNFRQLDEQT